LINKIEGIRSKSTPSKIGVELEKATSVTAKEIDPFHGDYE
jgi:hypothetical protein